MHHPLGSSIAGAHPKRGKMPWNQFHSTARLAGSASGRHRRSLGLQSPRAPRRSHSCHLIVATTAILAVSCSGPGGSEAGKTEESSTAAASVSTASTPAESEEPVAEVTVMMSDDEGRQAQVDIEFNGRFRAVEASSEVAADYLSCSAIDPTTLGFFEIGVSTRSIPTAGFDWPPDQGLRITADVDAGGSLAVAAGGDLRLETSTTGNACTSGLSVVVYPSYAGSGVVAAVLRNEFTPANPDGLGNPVTFKLQPVALGFTTATCTGSDGVAVAATNNLDGSQSCLITFTG